MRIFAFKFIAAAGIFLSGASLPTTTFAACIVYFNNSSLYISTALDTTYLPSFTVNCSPASFSWRTSNLGGGPYADSLQKQVGGVWSTVSTSGSYSGTTGTYRYVIKNSGSSGSFKFTYKNP